MWCRLFFFLRRSNTAQNNNGNIIFERSFQIWNVSTLTVKARKLHSQQGNCCIPQSSKGLLMGCCWDMWECCYKTLLEMQKSEAADSLRRDSKREMIDWVSDLLEQSLLTVRDWQTHGQRRSVRMTDAQRQRSTEEHMGDTVTGDMLSRPLPALTLTIA